jgi:hypothetical protein
MDIAVFLSSLDQASATGVGEAPGTATAWWKVTSVSSRAAAIEAKWDRVLLIVVLR